MRFILLLTWGLLAGMYAAAQPVAKFGASGTSGCAPLIVQFSDSSTGSISTWYWDFGNGSSVLQNPTWTYSTAGIYNVLLTVTGPGGNTLYMPYAT